MENSQFFDPKKYLLKIEYFGVLGIQFGWSLQMANISPIYEYLEAAPEDIAVVGFSNSVYSSMTDPPLTTVEQQGFKMGERAAKLLFDRINSDEIIDPRAEQIKTALIVRGSSLRE